MDYSKLTDKELDRAVAERLELADPWPNDRCPWCGWEIKQRPEDGCIDGNCSLRPLPKPKSVDRYRRPFSTDPGAWGWLLERERMDLTYDYIDHRWDCQHPDVDIGTSEGFGDTPGRAICIAYLEATR